MFGIKIWIKNMKLKLVKSCLLMLALYAPITQASRVGWEVHNHTNHEVDVELSRYCMSDSAHDGLHTIAPGASFDYEELGTVNSGWCFFHKKTVVIKIYHGYMTKSYRAQSEGRPFEDGPEHNTDYRVKVTDNKTHDLYRTRFDIVQ